MILVGELALWVALLMAAWGAIVSLAGGRSGRADLIQSAVRSVYAAFACVVLAISGLLVALISSDFTFRFVASFTSANLPVPYKIAALWSGPAGTLLFCTLVLCTCAAVVCAARPEREDQWTSHVSGVFSAIAFFLIATVCFAANPYERIVPPPVEGQGMFPALQHPGFAMHAPLLYLGSMSSSVPFALAVTALAAGRIDGKWTVVLRRWALLSWFLLAIGMIAGMWWGYVEAGDVGHWALDPARNLSILPWLTTSALLYSMRVEARRASIVLAVASFPIAVLGMFIVRGGMISVNPVASWSGASEWLTAFLAASTLMVAYLLATRLPRFDTRSPVRGDVQDKHGRFGRYAMQLGLVLLVAGFIGNRFGKEVEITLGPGETSTITDPFGDRNEFTSQGVSRFDVLNRHVVAVALQVAHDGGKAELMTSEERQYVDSRGAHTFDPTIEAGIDYSLKQDVYVVLTGVAGERAQVRVALNPLVMWVWIGGAMIAVGGAVALWGED